jgi:hypothetical protein
MTRLEGESTLHPKLDQPAGRFVGAAAAAVEDEDEAVEEEDEEVEEVEVEVEAGATALKTFILHEPPQT